MFNSIFSLKATKYPVFVPPGVLRSTYVWSFNIINSNEVPGISALRVSTNVWSFNVINSFSSSRQQGTRHLYYLQLRKDVLEGGIFVHEETAMLLASYALQAEVGDYNQSVHGSDYFVPEHYLPQRVGQPAG